MKLLFYFISVMMSGHTVLFDQPNVEPAWRFTVEIASPEVGQMQNEKKNLTEVLF